MGSVDRERRIARLEATQCNCGLSRHPCPIHTQDRYTLAEVRDAVACARFHTKVHHIEWADVAESVRESWRQSEGTQRAIDHSRTHEPKGEDGGLSCPFCEEGDFDAWGLKLHLTCFCQPFARVRR